MRPPVIYQLRVKDHLDAGLAGWFAPLQLINEANGEAVLTGPVRDQAELHGLLSKVRDLNLTLLLVKRLEAEPDNHA
jgi:hypothetical protein